MIQKSFTLNAKILPSYLSNYYICKILLIVSLFIDIFAQIVISKSWLDICLAASTVQRLIVCLVILSCELFFFQNILWRIIRFLFSFGFQAEQGIFLYTWMEILEVKTVAENALENFFKLSRMNWFISVILLLGKFIGFGYVFHAWKH